MTTKKREYPVLRTNAKPNQLIKHTKISYSIASNKSNLKSLQPLNLKIHQTINSSHFLFQGHLPILVNSVEMLPWFLKYVNEFPKNYMWKISFYGKGAFNFSKTTVPNPLLKPLKVLSKTPCSENVI